MNLFEGDESFIDASSELLHADISVLLAIPYSLNSSSEDEPRVFVLGIKDVVDEVEE